MERLNELQEHLKRNPKIKKVWIKGEDWLFNKPMTKTKEGKKGKDGGDDEPAQYVATEGWSENSASDILKMKVKADAEAGSADDGKGKEKGGKDKQ